MPRTPEEQLVHFLSDMFSVEQQALAQMESAPDSSGAESIAKVFDEHYRETQEQADLVRERLEAHGGSPSVIKDTVMKLGGKGFLLFARVQPKTPGKLIAHAYSYEAMEWAGYEMLIRFAQHSGDQKTIQTAKAIRDQERSMMHRLEQQFDVAEDSSHAEESSDKLDELLWKHVTEAHALDAQGIKLLDKRKQIAGNESLESVYSQLRDKMQAQAELLEQQLARCGQSTSAWRDATLEMAALNWSLFFTAQSDTPAKLAAFVYAVLHLEIGGYQLLKQTAERAANAETTSLCEQIIRERYAMADQLAAAFDQAVTATLGELETT
ncbi:protein containing DUF892 [Rhodopirellula baltica SH28]|uniref:Protein containing DUF892 n=1 Tax=Rhodopirellula baltica SH28 TaxID=993517 RepID=K5CYW3_RHOBT|nr:DUF892 family protein [Rhodopirellula baltica]EKJ99321.1 protein containing DUF892 [Rhodopirellula baltica SH28]